MFCKFCKDEVTDKKRRSYCSDRCSELGKREYQKGRKFNYEQVKKWRLLVKRKAIDYKGGKCQICGYDKCVRSLDFHHVDPTKKDFAISEFKNRKIEKLKDELDKCILLCSNCHGEVHDGILDVSNVSMNLNIKLLITEKKENRCSMCGCECRGVVCKDCYKPKRKVERPTYDVLMESVNEIGYCGTGRKYGVSDNSIRKWIKNAS